MNQPILKKAIIYLRVSTEEQVDNYSLDTQEEICRKEAIRRGYEIIMIFREEGKSAKNIAGRPVLISLLEYCRKNKKLISAVFVYRLDRVSRQTSDYLAIRKKLSENGTIIISATEPTGDSPTEKLVETMLAAFGQLDNDVRSERTKNGLRARFMKGLLSTTPPIGYMMQSGYAIKDPETFGKMKKSWDLMATGTKSLREISKIMSEWGLLNKTSNRKYVLRPQALSKIFRSKFYIGILMSSRYTEEVKGQHTPMISEQQYYKVQSILDGRDNNKEAHSQYRVRDNDTFPLRRLAKCGKCGFTLTGYWSQGRNAKYAYYRCARFCTGKAVKVEILDALLVNLLKKITPSPECLELTLNFIQTHYYRRLSRLHTLRDNADNEIDKLRQLRNQLVEKNLAGTFSDEIFKEQNAYIEDKITKAQIAKHDETFEKYDINRIIDFMKALLVDLGEMYKRSDLGQKKALLGAIFPSGITYTYEGISHQGIRAIYQAIHDGNISDVSSGSPERTRTSNLEVNSFLLYH